jgi:cell division protein FtsI (penicillin-binding protein 3)
MLLAAILMAFTGVSARLAHLQLLAPEAHAERGMAQRLRTVELPAQRGSLFDRNGNELAMSVPQQTVWADPKLVVDRAAAAARLAPVLDMEEADLLERLGNGNSRFVYLARQVDGARGDAVEALDLDGIHLREEPRRFRPAGALAAGVLGDVDVDGEGVSGLEHRYEERLSGDPGELLVERGADGGTIAGGERRLRPAVRGDDLVLTLDRSLQYEVERALSEQVTATGADGAMAVVMDPRSGDILAMAAVEAGAADGTPRPTTDNPTLSDVFEPGSVSKVVTLGAVIEERVAEPDDVMSVPDSLRVGPKTFTDSSSHQTEPMSVAEVLGQSSNVGTIMLAREMGEERLGEYLTRFGFGTTTGLDFPGETAGLIPPVESWASTSIGSIAIGQGIAVNAVQMLGAFNVVANDGVRPEPRLVRSVVDPTGREQAEPDVEGVRVISEETAAKMTTMLESAVGDGTGLNARVEGYSVAGKTGTARKPSTEFRGYEPGAYTSVFAGFVPVQDPQLSIIVILDEATPYYGGVVAAPVFAEIAEYGLRLLRVPPTVAPPAEPVEVAPSADDLLTQD